MTSGKIIGDTVQYRLEAPIASGAFSTVYRCTELSTGKAYAMKIVDKKLAVRNKMTEALVREVTALEVTGNSPYVTRIVDKMVSKHNYYLVMVLAEGGTLLDLIREHRNELKQKMGWRNGGPTAHLAPLSMAIPILPYEQTQRYFKQLLLALSTLHDHNIVHRDVKPENILLNKRRTRIVLSDFGFACECPPEGRLCRACGTLRYCAPELLREHPRYDGRKVDVWAAGVSLHMMLFGGFPYRSPHADPDSLLEVIEGTPYRVPRPIPAPIEDMLHHMLCIDADQRWSVKQLLQHPWMAGPEPRSPSAHSTNALRPYEGAIRPTTAPCDAPEPSEKPASAPLEAYPPVEVLLSDEDNVDDGFYQSSCCTAPAYNVENGSSENTSATPPRQTSSPAETFLTHREVFSDPVSSITSPLHNPLEVGRSSGFEAQPTPSESTPALSHTSDKREVLKHGTMSTSMTSVESSVASDDGCDLDEDDEDEVAIESCYWDEVREEVMHPRNEKGTWSRNSSLTAYISNAGDASLDVWWQRYGYGLWLTVRMAVRLIAFVVVCILAIVLRVSFNCDVVDLPLPDSVRNRISSLLSTPLRRPRAHARSAGVGRSPIASSSSVISSVPTSKLLLQRRREPDSGISAAHHSQHPFPIPGSGLRHYVRTADQLMRDSFVGNVVRTYNASLANVTEHHHLSGASHSSRASEGHSRTSSPATPSVATIAPINSSLHHRHVARESSMDLEERRDGSGDADKRAGLSASSSLSTTRRKQKNRRGMSPCIEGN